MEERQPRKLAVILHADVVRSTALVQRDESLAHERIRDAFHRFSGTIESYNGHPLELRGDALVAEFNRASDAVEASLAFQAENTEFNSTLEDEIRPTLRIGISLGEVVVADNTITGEGIVLAQRLEQLASAGGVCIQGAVYEAVPGRLPFEYESLGEHELKGFSEPVRAYAVSLTSGEAIPPPEVDATSGEVQPKRPKQRWVVVSAMAFLVIAGGGLAWFQPWAPREEPASVESAALSLPDKPSIVVLPFANYYDDGKQDYFVDGFTNAITTHLSKFPQLFVISSTTAFTYKGKSVRVTDIGRDLGVKYVLEGSVQRGTDTLSIHAQLIEAETDRHVWAEQYDVPPEKVFSVQADLISEIVGTLRFALREEAVATVLKRPAANLQGYDLYLKASAVSKKISKESWHEAIRLLKQVVEIDPEFLEAHYRISTLYLSLWRFNMTDNAKETLRLARLHAEKAMEIDQADYRGHYLIGQLSLFADHEHDLALAEFQRALADNPNEANILYYMGFLKTLMGQGEEAIAWNEKAKRVNPRYPGWYNFNAALAHFWVQGYEKATLLAKSGIAAYPKTLAPRRILIATLVEMGRLDEAKQEVADYLEIRPNFRLSTFRNTPFKHQADQDRYFDALRKAGIPD
jgi:TolB-like protein/class 3 adenylate cyclase